MKTSSRTYRIIFLQEQHVEVVIDHPPLPPTTSTCWSQHLHQGLLQLEDDVRRDAEAGGADGAGKINYPSKNEFADNFLY